MNQLLTEEKTRFPSSDIIGTKVSALGFNDAVEAILRWSQRKEHRVVCVCNVHMVVEASKDASLSEILGRADMVASDGMPLVWLMKRRGLNKAERVAGPDLLASILERAGSDGPSVYFFGGSPATIEAMKAAIASRFSALKVAGYEAPPMLPARPPVNNQVVDRIRQSGAHIVFVGLGCPKQEYWMAAHSPHIPAVLIGVGAAFDFLAGTVPRAPMWMQRSGLEWLFRLLSEPRRLWRRYLKTNALFLWHLLTSRRR